MENLWLKAHQFILDSKIGDFYMSGDEKVFIIRRTPKRIYFSNEKIISIKKSKHGYFYFSGKNVNQMLRDIEGYFLFLTHAPMI